MEVDLSDNLQINTGTGINPASHKPISNGQNNDMAIDQDYTNNYDYEETEVNPDGFFVDTKTAAACSVRVALRVRPLVGRELYESPNICITCYPESNQLNIGKDRPFTFDKIFDIGTNQEDVYEICVKNLVLGCFQGYNATVLAYGQTGSGKTFTMGSGYTIGLKEEDLGIIPRVIRLIFNEVDKRKHKAEFIIKCTFLEIYNEELHDLLDHGNVGGAGIIDRFITKKDITIREEKNGCISVFGLREEKVSTYEELAACLDKGSNFRSTASTLMNNCSSRSHAIFTISIEQHAIEDLYKADGPAKPQSSDSDEFMVAKFHFVDLAGSERAKRTGATGKTLQEGISINKGLLSLGNVIAALTDDNKKGHVPYRDSKLTRILQDSLGGNSRTSMIACVSPAEINFEETLNTLKYASRARNIKNKPIVNRDPNSAQIAQLRQQIYELSRELVGCRKLLISNNIEFESLASIPNDFSQGNEVKHNDASHSKEYMIGASELQKYEQEIKDLRIDRSQKEKKVQLLTTQNEQLNEKLSQSQIEFYTVQKEKDLSRYNLERIVEVLKKRNIFNQIMAEIQGKSSSEQMDIDEGDKKVDFDQEIGSGMSIIEEYRTKAEEYKKELSDKTQRCKTLEKDYEHLFEQSQQDVKSLETKEKEIERLKRSVNKFQKEITQLKNDQRRGTKTAFNPQQSVAPQNSQASVAAVRRGTTMNTERKTSVISPVPQLKKRIPQQPLQDASNDQWISRELENNIQQFNELFINNLSQSLSSMLVKKPIEKTTQEEGVNNDVNQAVAELDDNVIKQDQNAEESSDEEMPEEEDIDEIIPQGEKEQQEVIESNEEVKQEDEQKRETIKASELEVNNLEVNLKDKEQFLAAIKESHDQVSKQLLLVMKNEYHNKILQFQQEMHKLEEEKSEKLKSAVSQQQKNNLEDSYKKKLKELEEKLVQAKQKEKEQKSLTEKSSEQKKKISSLENEISSIKKQKVDLQKKIKEENEQHRKWKQERVKELLQMKQANLKKDKEIQMLRRDNKKKDQIAQRKQQELSALQKRSKNEKAKQINAQNQRNQKKNIDIGHLQNWIMQNTDKMLQYKQLQQELDVQRVEKNEIESLIQEEEAQKAHLSVRKEQLEIRLDKLKAADGDNEDERYQILEEVNQLDMEIRAHQDNIDTYDEKGEFIEDKISQVNIKVQDYNPNEVEQLKFDEVQSIEGARACLSAFFGILLDVNVYKKQLEGQLLQNESTLESLNSQLEELQRVQQANEQTFQKQLEQQHKEYQEKEDLLIKLILENGGPEIEQLMQNLNLGSLNGRSLSKQEIEQASQQPKPIASRRGTLSQAQIQIQKTKTETVNQSKTQLSKKVVELERQRQEDAKKLETLKHKYESSETEKERFKRQLEQVKSKMKTQEINEIKQAKFQSQQNDDMQSQYGTQKSPRQNSQTNKAITNFNELRNQKKQKKQQDMQTTNTQQQRQQATEPKVIADEPMEDEEHIVDDNPFTNRQNSNNDQNQLKGGIISLKSMEICENNVFQRLSQIGKVKPINTSNLNTTQTVLVGGGQPYVQPASEFTQQTGFQDDNKWKCIFNKEAAHQAPISALASVGNQLYSSSNKSLKIWDIERMTVVSDITAHSSFIKSMCIWEEKKLLLTASQNVIILWDMISLTQVGSLKGHAEEIRAMAVTKNEQYLFSAGKGTATSPSLLIWDLKSGPDPLEKREKSQDIFSLALTDDYLFYGCRNHNVVPMKLRTYETLEAFKPPHFDAVTSLAFLDNQLISGSRDKNLRCWDYSKILSGREEGRQTDQYVQNVLQAHNDYIYALETDQIHKDMYSGSKDGTVKVWKMKQQRLKCTASLTASNSGAVNAVCKLDKQFGRMFASGGGDRQLRIWKYKSTNNSMNNSPQEDCEEEENAEKMGNDSNNNNEQCDYGQSQDFVKSSDKYEEQKQEPQKLNITVKSGQQVIGYQPSSIHQKYEMSRRATRLQGRNTQKENNNFQSQL